MSYNDAVSDKNVYKAQRKLEEANDPQALDLLRGLEFFQGFSKKELRALLALRAPRHCAIGDAVILEGGRDEGVYVLLAGRVRVAKGGQLFAGMTAGAIFGEMAFYSKYARTADVVAEEECMVLCLDEDLLHHLESDLRGKLLDRIFIFSRREAHLWLLPT
ncbi:MAG: cyclic nucleotide-binding domain-containing protein [Magnetococcales bacterium]|nr:cyclic nucleotide-binding domain-containing protein [Magnetococcales bacterium]